MNTMLEQLALCRQDDLLRDAAAHRLAKQSASPVAGISRPLGRHPRGMSRILRRERSIHHPTTSATPAGTGV